MGTCGIKSRKTNSQSNVQNTRIQPVVPPIRSHVSKHNEQKEKFEFLDFEEDKSAKPIGEGIKQIPSYKCTIPFDQLKELRDKFWTSKIQQSRRWKAIREICESDSETAVQLLEAAEFVCKDNLRYIMELTNYNVVYKVPNFCITDPIFKRDYNAFEKDKDNCATNNISIILYCSLTNKETKLVVSNKTLGKDLKEMFSKEEKFPLSEYRIRLFYSGQEIADNNMLFFHGLDNNSKLQVMCIKNL